MSKKIYIKIDKPIEVGDLVRCVRDNWPLKVGDIRKVSQMGMDSKVFFYICGSERPLRQKFWEPVRKETRVDESRGAEMKQEVAEMIVELLDREDKENCPQSSVFIANWRNFDNTVTASGNGNKSHTATLSPSDTWDTLTGVYVALSKATGRELPDWIYGGKNE